MARYRVRIDPRSRQLDLVLSLERDDSGDLELAIPTWVPGAYAFMKYGRDVFDLRAEDTKTGARLGLERTGQTTFTVQAAPAHVTLRARIVASDTAWAELVGFIGHENAVIHASHFPFAPAHAGACTISVEAPKGWAIHHPGGAVAIDAQTWEHPNFRALVDTPIIAGSFALFERVSGGCTFRHVFLGKAIGFDREVQRLIDDVMAIADSACKVFGAYPMREYTFVYGTDPRAYWGLEHAYATLMGVGEAVFIDPEQRRAALRLAAHELFHAWNVCRLRPKAFHGANLDLVRGAFPDGLWLSEGFTRYYELLLATRTGALPASRFLSNIVRYHDAVRALPAARHVSLVDSSRATFLNHNRYPGASSATIDYYDKGMLVAFALDAALRTAKRPSSLDAALVAFYEAFVEKGFETAEAIAFFDRFAAPLEPVEPVAALLERIVVGTEMPDTTAWLERLGLTVAHGSVQSLGLWLRADRGPEITDVVDGSPAARAGLGAGDEIMTLDGFAFRPDALTWLVRTGEPFSIGVRSGHAHRDATVTPSTRETIVSLSLAASGESLVSWLGEGARSLEVGASIPLTHYDNFHARESLL
jgi:predicted metalloprotease with PDZ domain